MLHAPSSSLAETLLISSPNLTESLFSVMKRRLLTVENNFLLYRISPRDAMAEFLKLPPTIGGRPTLEASSRLHWGEDLASDYWWKLSPRIL
jgi:hypothetical protein